MYKSKAKKKLRTTLGTAPPGSNQEKHVDVSNLRQPIETSVFGLRQVLNLLDTATLEVRNYISYECDIIYECRVCRTLFRSLANFILHKREYCRDPHLPYTEKKDEEAKPLPVRSKAPPSSESESPLKSEEEATTPILPSKLDAKRTLRDVVTELENRLKNDEISNKAKKDEPPIKEPPMSEVVLEEIGPENIGVFQTAVQPGRKLGDELMKSEVMEIHSMLGADEAIIGPNGKVVAPATHPKSLICNVCNQHFSTRKTLTHHVKYKHNDTRIVYLCPESGCTGGGVFANTWSVFRHLYKVHRKTSMQVKRLRSQIQTSVVRRGDITEDEKGGDVQKTVQQTINEQTIQWMDNFEGDNDLQMCGGCGKRFERKAALNSHSQTCAKRQALCNSMRRLEEESRRIESAPKAKIKSGSQRRKQKPVKIPTIASSPVKDVNVADELKPPEDAEEKMNVPETHVHEEAPKKTAEEKRIAKQKRIARKRAAEEKRLLEQCVDDDVILVDTSSIFEPETILSLDTEVGANEIIECEPIVVCLSDDEDVVMQEDVVTLETKASQYADYNEEKCKPCDHKCADRDELLTHMSSHFKWFRFQCSICLYKSYDEKTVQSHINKSHPNAAQSPLCEIPHEDVIKNSVEFQSVIPPPQHPHITPDNNNEEERLTSENAARDPSIQKMIMEVIFGSTACSAEAAQPRPVRNRVNKKNDDFVYEEDIKKLTALTRPVKLYTKKRKLCGDFDAKE